MIDKYLSEQYLVTTLLKKEIENDKVVQAYMFNGNDIDYLMKYAKDFSAELITINLDDELKKSIVDKIENNIYNELKIIEPENNMIKKDQFLSIKEYLSNKPLEGNNIIYIIKNCELMNLKTANSMLKFIEDASDNLIAIFLTNNIDMVIPTIKSRCQVLNFSNVVEKNLISSLNVSEEEIESYVTDVVDFILLFENQKINTFYKSKTYVLEKFKDNKDIKIFLDLLLYFYYDVFNRMINQNVKYFDNNIESIDKVCNINGLSSIINKIGIIEKTISNNKYNLNQKLMIDNLIIELSEV